MLSVMRSKRFDSDSRNDAVRVTDLRVSIPSSSGAGNEEMSSISTTSGEPHVYEEVKNGVGMDLGRDVCLDSDSSSEARVPHTDLKEGNDHKFVAIKNESRKLNAKVKYFSSEAASKSEYDTMLSKFDDFAANGKPWAVGWGYEMGDMVWGKVKSHPWWPGHIFHEVFATTSVRRSKRDGNILVAFFGDSSYGWFEPSELVPFDPNFREKSQQTNLRSFTKAVDEAIDELSRRCALGLICGCRHADNFRPVSAEGFYEVDLNENEKNFIYSASQIKRARESFHPRETLAFTKKLALTPTTGDGGDINFIKNKATVIAYRKAVFAPHDPTYAEAFGAHVPKHIQQMHPVNHSSKGPQRASLSGRLISVRHNKALEKTEKDRYLFKRRDELENMKNLKVGEVQAGSSSQPIRPDISGFPSSGTDNAKCTPVEEVEHPLNQIAAVGEVHCVGEMHTSLPAESKPQCEESKSRSPGEKEKVKNRKRPTSDTSSETVHVLEKKKKKKKEVLGMNTSSDFPVNPKTEEDSDPVPLDAGEVKETDTSQKGDGASISLPEQAVSHQATGVKSVELELPQLLCNLQSLALNPFYGLGRGCPATTRTAFLRFRSQVFQKSLASSPIENESNQAPHSKLPAVAPPASDSTPAERMRETTPVKMPQQKPSARPDDPTRGGRKRAPSDRQEEISAKKKKKMNDLKILTTERKAPQRTPEATKDDGKEMVTKTKPEFSKRTEQSVKVSEPTMLIMKFPPKGALPSIPELKVKFSRFGPLDHSATRVFWKSLTCRLVYRYKHHAEAALKYAESSTNLFGNTDVKCSLREAEAPEVPREDKSSSQSKSVLGGRPSARATQQAVQLKSCLKRPPSEDGGNGSNRGTRVKFDLGGEDSNRAELSIDSKNTKTSIAASSSDSTNVKNFSKDVLPPPQLPPAPPPVISTKFQNPPTNLHSTEATPHRNVHNFNAPSAPFAATTTTTTTTPPTTTNMDISHQMVSLLTKCHEVVTNLTNVLGYTPYHPL